MRENTKQKNRQTGRSYIQGSFVLYRIRGHTRVLTFVWSFSKSFSIYGDPLVTNGWGSFFVLVPPYSDDFLTMKNYEIRRYSKPKIFTLTRYTITH